MINAIMAHGSSFKGLANYVLHDIGRADTSDRVAWTETQGLATDDPHKAWRVMASTAMNQNELKKSAGVGNTGRKSHKNVMHYVLSWHPEERETLTREEMVAAAKASMTYLGTYEGEKLGVHRSGKQKGKAILAKRTQHGDEHQALIVCHDDGPGKAPHVHVVLNRVHPEHGVFLPDTKEQEKLAAWALDYRTAQGKTHYCPQRQITAAKKAQGVLVSNPRKPRNLYEQEQEAQTVEPDSRKKAQLDAHKRRTKTLQAKTAAMKERHAEQRQSLDDRHLAAERKLGVERREKTAGKLAEVRRSYAPKFDALLDRHASERAAFEQAKQTTAGRVRNAWNALKTREWMTEIRSRPLGAIKHGFALAFDSGLQQKDLEKHHAREVSRLRGRRRSAEKEVRKETRLDYGLQLNRLQDTYTRDRLELNLAQGMQTAKLKAEWKQLDRDRAITRKTDERSLGRHSESGGGGGGRRHDPVTPDQLKKALASLSEPASKPEVDPPDVAALTKKVLERLDAKRPADQGEDRDRGMRR